MNKIVLKIFLFSNMIFFQQIELAQSIWENVYTEFPNTRLFCVKETFDGGFVAAGDGVEGVFCMKVDLDGDVIWQKDYQIGGGNFSASSMIIDSLGDIFLAGEGQDLDNYNVYGFLLGLNSNGDSLFTKYYPQEGWSFFDKLIEGYNNSFVIVGSMDNRSSGGDTDVWLLAMKRNGEVLWENYYDEEEFEYGRDVVRTLDNGFMILAELTDSNSAVKIIKTDSLGVVHWEKNYRKDSLRITPNSIIATREEEYLIIGEVDGYNLIDTVINGSWLLNLNFEGSVNWEKRFNWPVKEGSSEELVRTSSHQAISAVQNIDHSYTMVGKHSTSYGFISESEDIEALYLYSIKENGDSLWRSSFETELWPAVYDMQSTSDGGFIIPAYMWNWDDPSLPWLLKTDFEGNIPVSVDKLKLELPFEFSLFQNYPNPFNPSTNIQYEIPDQARNDDSHVQLKIYDVLGKEVATLVNKEQSVGNYEVEFRATELSSGVYFYTLRAGDFVETKKMLLLR